MKKMALACLMAGASFALAGCGGGADNQPAPELQAEAANDPAPAPAAAPVQASVEAKAQASSAPPRAFLQCRSCHSVEPARRGIGPSLHGIVGRQAASVDGFGYTPALKKSGLIWDRATLDTWIESPIKMVPGTRMMHSVRNPEQRRAILDYLETVK